MGDLEYDGLVTRCESCGLLYFSEHENCIYCHPKNAKKDLGKHEWVQMFK